MEIESMRRAGWLLLLFAAACTELMGGPPPPAPMSLSVPPPPEPVPGKIHVYGDELPESRGREIEERLRAADPDVLSAYETYRQSDISLTHYSALEGRLQLRLGINDDGKIVTITPAFSEVDEGLIGEVDRVLRGVSFPPGPQAWVYETFRFDPNALEVVKIATDFAAKPPSVVAVVENRSMFQIPAVSATVTVLGPEKAKALRTYRRRVDESFAPGDRHELRIPIDGEWATARNSFLVVVRPTKRLAPTGH
jgi:hypothetical protein